MYGEGSWKLLSTKWKRYIIIILNIIYQVIISRNEQNYLLVAPYLGTVIEVLGNFKFCNENKMGDKPNFGGLYLS